MANDEDGANPASTPTSSKSPEVYKTRRATIKRMFTRTVNSIEQKIKSRASKDAMELLRENIADLMNQSLHHHTKYVTALAPTGEALKSEEQWASRTDEAAREAFSLIDDYLNSLSTTTSEDSSKRQHAEGDDRTEALAEAKKRRLAAEEALRAGEESINKKIEEFRRNSDVQLADLQEEVRRQRAIEESLEKVSSGIPAGPSTPRVSSQWYGEPSPLQPPRQSIGQPSTSGFNWMSTLLPKIEIAPFNGDPRIWRSFARSFKELVHDVLPSNSQRIAALRNMLTPDVRHGFEQMLRNPSNYERVIDELHNKYGEPYLIKRAYLHSLQRIKNCKEGDDSALRDLAAQLHDVTAGLQDEDCSHMIFGPSLEMITDKLPGTLRSKWGVYAYRRRPAEMTLADLDCWLQEKSTEKNGRDQRGNEQLKALQRNLHFLQYSPPPPIKAPHQAPSSRMIRRGKDPLTGLQAAARYANHKDIHSTNVVCLSQPHRKPRFEW